MAHNLLYFAYGSNLHPLRLIDRVGEVVLVGAGRVCGMRLRFHKLGRDGSGKCSIVRTDQPDESVHGAVYRLSRRQVRDLDGFESRGNGYQRCRIETHVASTGLMGCFTYVAMREFVDEELAPFGWYKRLVLEGARYHGLPEAHVAQVERQLAVEDPDPHRRERERSRAIRTERFRGS